MIRKLIFGNGIGSANASDYQEEAHTMCREGLTNYTPRLMKVRDARGALKEIDASMLEALHDIERQLDKGQWLASMELYTDDYAFNVWVAYNSFPEAVGLYTYRPDSKPEPVKKGRRK